MSTDVKLERLIGAIVQASEGHPSVEVILEGLVTVGGLVILTSAMDSRQAVRATVTKDQVKLAVISRIAEDSCAPVLTLDEWRAMAAERRRQVEEL